MFSAFKSYISHHRNNYSEFKILAAFLKNICKNKWKFKHSIQWELYERALFKVSKTDEIFPLITNTKIEVCEVLKKYKSQPFLEKRMCTKKTVLEVAPVFLKKANPAKWVCPYSKMISHEFYRHDMSIFIADIATFACLQRTIK